MARCFLLCLNGWISMKLRLGNKREKRQHKLIECWDCRMCENHSLFWINSAGQIINNHIVDIVCNMLSSVSVCNDLVVSNNNIGMNTKILESYALNNGAKVMAKVKSSGGTIPCKHVVLSCILWQICLNLI